MKYLMLLNDNIESDKFSILIDIIFNEAEYFSLTKNFCIEKSRSECPIAHELDPFIINKFETTHWHSYYVTDENPLLINIYPLNESTKRTLSRVFSNLFLLNKDGVLDGYFEDICFFIGEELFLGSVSHESICNLYIDDHTSYYNDILSLANWKICNEDEIEHLQRERIQLKLK